MLEEDLPFYRKVLNSGAWSVVQERMVAIVTDFMLEHKDRFYPGSHEEYLISIQFCAGGLSNLYRDWFAGKLPVSLEQLTMIGENLICRVVGENI